MQQLFYFLQMLRNSKIKKTFLFLFLLFIMFLFYNYQKQWIFKNCTTSDIAPSCVYQNFRLYFFPIIIGFLFLSLLWVDKIISVFKKCDDFLDSLSEKKSFFLMSFFVFLFTLFLFYFHFSFVPLNPLNIKWMFVQPNSVNADHAFRSAFQTDLDAGYVFWSVFRNAPWHFPQSIIEQLNYPLGTTVGYIEPLSLLAYPFKLFRDYLPENFQYFGIWLFSCYIFQGFFASLLVKNWNTKFINKFMTIILIAFSPLLFFRLEHLSLNCHWLILASFCLYFSKNLSFSLKVFLHSFIICLAAWIHPYWVFMLFPLYLALLINCYFFEREKVLFLLSSFFVSLFVIFCSWYFIGYFYIGMDGFGGSGLSWYTANLNTFFNPLEGLSSVGSSQIINAFSIWRGQYEGYAYLGAGLLILMIAIFFENRQSNKSIFEKNNLPFFGALLFLSLFSLGTTIRFGRVSLLTYSYPSFLENLLGSFRSTGRFIWPLWYFLVYFILQTWLIRKRSEWKKSVLLLLVTIIQFFDIYPLYAPLHYPAGTYEHTLQIQKWINFMGKERNKILFYPGYYQNGVEDSNYKDFWYMVAKYHLFINMGYIIKHNKNAEDQVLNALKQHIDKAEFSADAIYVTSLKNKDIFNFSVKNHLAVCDQIDGYFVCKKS